jgi:hypothetical protein
VVGTGVDESLLKPIAVDRDRGLVGMLLDDREQVTEQTLLGCGELGVLGRGLRRGMIELVDGRPRGWNQRRRSTARAIAGGAVAGRLAPRAAQPPAGRFTWLLRNRRPSSCLLA